MHPGAANRADRWWPGALALGLLLLGTLDLAAAAHPSLAEPDPEEGYNALVSWLTRASPALALRLQYRDFCGGCTADAWLGAPLLALMGPRWLAWKLVPIAWTLLLVGGAATLVRRSEGAGAAAGAALLLALPPVSGLSLSLIAWGNHREAGVLGALAVLAAAAARRGGAGAAALAGLLAGLAVWVGFSGAYAAIAVALLLVGAGPRAALAALAGAAVGLLPWAAQALVAGTHPFVQIYEDGEAVPRLARVPHKLWTLFAPGQIGALWGVPGAAGVALGLAVLGAAGAAVRGAGPAGRAAALGAAIWLGVYSLVRFQVDAPEWPGQPAAGGLRYAAPVVPLLAILTGSAAGRAWGAGRRGRAALIALPWLLSGVYARAQIWTGPGPQPALGWSRLAGDLGHARPQLAYLIAGQALPDDPLSAHVAAYAAGRAWVQADGGPLPPGDAPSIGEGIGEAWADTRPAPDGAGAIAVLGALDAALAEAPPELRAAALRAAAWRQASANGGELPVGAPPTAASPAVRAALDFTAGRAAARLVAVPGPAPLPALPDGPDAQAGFAFGLGERWGPGVSLPAALTATPGAPAAWEAGVSRAWWDGPAGQGKGALRGKPLVSPAP